MPLTPNPTHDEIARYIDRKADVARKYATRYRPNDAEIHNHVARVLDALADEVRMGLASDTTPIVIPETGESA